MNTLTIADLARSEQLDRPTMAAVRGGWKTPISPHVPGDLDYAPTVDSSVSATQGLAQMQQVLGATANGSAFVEGMLVDSQVAHDGNNKIVQR